MAFAFYVQVLITHLIGFIYACLVLMYLFWKFITSPRRFIADTFLKKRDAMPACLNDATLGTHGFIHLEEVKLHYVVSGDESKPLILFLHGFPEFWYCWRHQIREFSKDYRVVAVDMRGYADSDKPSGYKNYQVEKLVTDIKQLIPALGFRSCVLVGHDWGAVVSWRVAMMYPDLIEKLIIMNSPHPLSMRKFMKSSKEQRGKFWYAFFCLMPFVPELLIQAMDFKVLHWTLLMEDKDGTRKSKNITNEDIEALKYALSRPGAITGPLNYYRASGKLQPLKTTGEVTVPTLIVWGLPDPYLCTELAALAGDYVKDLTVKYVEDAGHFVQEENPQEVNRIVREYLSGQK